MTDSIAISEGIDQRRLTTFRIIIGLIAVTFLSFYGVWRNEFINYDDNTYVFLNPDVIRGLDWQTIEWASTHVDACHWVPLTWISHALDCQLFGLNPSGHHITSLVLHISSVVLLFLALKLFTGSVWRSAMVAVLFGVHPTRRISRWDFTLVLPSKACPVTPTESNTPRIFKIRTHGKA